MLFSEHEMRPFWPWGSFEAHSFDLLMVDAAWHFKAGGNRGANQHYSVMSLEDIAALPVGDLAAPNSLLWLWATAPMLNQQITVIEKWGFTFKTSGVWVRTTKHGKIAFGTGYLLRNAHVPFLIGTRGNPVTTRSVRSVVMGRVRAHSQKPEEAYRAAEALMPGARRVELFSRTNRPGWSVWGNETGTFSEAI